MIPEEVEQLVEQLATDPKIKGLNQGTPGLRWKWQKCNTSLLGPFLAIKKMKWCEYSPRSG